MTRDRRRDNGVLVDEIVLVRPNDSGEAFGETRIEGFLAVLPAVLVDLLDLMKRRMMFADEEFVAATRVPDPLLVGQLRIDDGQSLEETRLVDERQQRHAHPRVLFPVQIHFEVRRVEVDDGGRGFAHERLEGRRDVAARGGGEDGHQLLHRFEGLSVFLEIDLEIRDADEIGGEGGVVVGEVPGGEKRR